MQLLSLNPCFDSVTFFVTSSVFQNRFARAYDDNRNNEDPKAHNELAQNEKDSKDLKSMVTPSVFTTIEKFRYTLEQIRGSCRMMFGADGTNLLYIIRDEDEPADYPDPNTWSIEETTVLRHPLYGRAFKKDNLRVWDMINSVFHGTDGWAWIEQFAPTGDGRSAYKALYRHFLDDNNCDTIVTAAIDTITGLVYRGEIRNFTFEKFAGRKLKTAYTELDAFSEKQWRVG